MAESELALGPAPSPVIPCSADSAADLSAVLVWRVAGLFGILVASIIGFVVPFFLRHPRYKNGLFLFRAFAAGVVLATGLVHVLPDATQALSDPCLGLPEGFPWTSVFATMAALMAFMVEYYLRESLLYSGRVPSALAPIKLSRADDAGTKGIVVAGEGTLQGCGAGEGECVGCAMECADCARDCQVGVCGGTASTCDLACPDCELEEGGDCSVVGGLCASPNCASTVCDSTVCTTVTCIDTGCSTILCTSAECAAIPCKDAKCTEVSDVCRVCDPPGAGQNSGPSRCSIGIEASSVGKGKSEEVEVFKGDCRTEPALPRMKPPYSSKPQHGTVPAKGPASSRAGCPLPDCIECEESAPLEGVEQCPLGCADCEGIPASPVKLKPQEGAKDKTAKSAAVCVGGNLDCMECGLSSPGPVEGDKRVKGGERSGDGTARETLMRYRAAAMTLEAGIIFHSLFVGIALGTSHDAQYVQGLAIALCFHQGFEGLSLGASLVKAQLSRMKVVVLGTIFALTTPAGIAIGLGVGSAYNANGPVALGIDGAFGAVSAGILLYAGLVDLAHPTFDKCDPSTPKNKWVVGLGFLALFLGAGFMSLLAKWA